jgi:hypothetical protein
MGGTQKYLCRKVQEGEIENDDLLESQAKLTLLREAPKLVLDAIAKGWMTYPDKIEGQDDDDDTSQWIGKYDCERAYYQRQKGLTYREIGKLMGCGIARVVHILNRGEEIVLQRKLNERVNVISIPSKETVNKLIPKSKSKSK